VQVSGGGSTSDSKLIVLFLLYVIVCTFLRVIIKRLGMECDKLKMNTTSMFFIAEFFCLMYYYLFYRVLFESIPDWGTFFALVRGVGFTCMLCHIPVVYCILTSAPSNCDRRYFTSASSGFAIRCELVRALTGSSLVARAGGDGVAISLKTYFSHMDWI
jgi:hypothetical protein